MTIKFKEELPAKNLNVTILFDMVVDLPHRLGEPVVKWAMSNFLSSGVHLKAFEGYCSGFMGELGIVETMLVN